MPLENPAPASDARLSALTGLRFIAAMMIFWHHSHTMFGLPNPGLGLDQGVSFFFILSGFILSYVYPKLDDAGTIRRFFIARVARIWPAHLVTLALFFVFTGATLNWYFLANLFLVQSWIPILNSYFSFNAVSWSISTEFFFYLMFPLLIGSFSRRWFVYLLAAAAVVIGFFALANGGGFPSSSNDHVSVHGLVYINPLVRLFEFVAGMCCCLLWKRLQSWRMPDSLALFTLLECAALALAIYLMTNPLHAWSYRFHPAGNEWFGHTSGIPGFCAVLIVFAMGRGLLSRVLSTRTAIVLGEISFSLYLVHSMVLSLFPVQLKGLLNAPWHIGFLCALAVTLALAYLIWALAEMPARQLIRDLGERKAFAFRRSARMFLSRLVRPGTLLLIVFILCFAMFADRMGDYRDTVLVLVEPAPKAPPRPGGTCSVDRVKYRSSIFGHVSFVEFSGWAFDERILSAPHDVRLRLISPEGDFLVPLQRIQRVDVSGGFKLGDAPAGWSANVNLAELHGRTFKLAIEQGKAEWRQCEVRNRLELGESRALLKP
jgi:peptidoglycan/LPS O-acetylase OafA/YrhL